MRRLAFLLLGGALAFVPAAPAMAVSPVVVPAAAGWVETGVEVEGGDVLRVQTLGYAQTAMIPEFFVPGEFISASGPEGQAGANCGDVGLDPALCFVADAPFGQLVGRVGDVTFGIGDTSSIEIPAGTSGTLKLAVNDFEIYLDDNRGAFTVIFR